MANSVVTNGGAGSANPIRPLVGGAGVTTMKWGKDVIGFCNGVTVTYPKAITQEVEVQPLDAVRPLEIVTSKAITGGTIALTLTTLYNQQIWDRFSELAQSNDLADIFAAIQTNYYAAGKNPLTVERLINPNIANATPYTESFQNCVVSEVSDGFNITPMTMLIDRTLTVRFTRHIKSTGFTYKT
jgi:hypothetical protein